MKLLINLLKLVTSSCSGGNEAVVSEAQDGAGVLLHEERWSWRLESDFKRKEYM